jgi:riboflavin kinase/FMN adenylyltransferase
VTHLVRLDDVTDTVRGGAISIGNFDGVHLGHAALLAKVRAEADRLGGPAVAVVLDPHPAAILRPDRVPPRLTGLERRAELVSPLGIDFLVVCPVSAEFLRMSAETFFDDLVLRRLGARAIVEGPNFFFGHQRKGDVAYLESLCRVHGIELMVVEPHERPVTRASLRRPGNRGDSGMISSTRIRDLIARGEIEAATELLGHPHRIRGRVVRGDGRGRTIGFPTANLTEIDVMVPAPGVYGGVAMPARDPRGAAIHIGPRPTFEAHGGEQVEVHVLDFEGDLYGQWLQVDLLTHVRDIARFESADQLIEQLSDDLRTIRHRLPERHDSSN